MGRRGKGITDRLKNDKKCFPTQEQVKKSKGEGIPAGGLNPAQQNQWFMGAPSLAKKKKQIGSPANQWGEGLKKVGEKKMGLVFAPRRRFKGKGAGSYEKIKRRGKARKKLQHMVHRCLHPLASERNGKKKGGLTHFPNRAVPGQKGKLKKTRS